jgi:hypothetical protein
MLCTCSQHWQRRWGISSNGPLSVTTAYVFKMQNRCPRFTVSKVEASHARGHAINASPEAFRMVHTHVVFREHTERPLSNPGILHLACLSSVQSKLLPAVFARVRQVSEGRESYIHSTGRSSLECKHCAGMQIAITKEMHCQASVHSLHIHVCGLEHCSMWSSASTSKFQLHV